MTDALSSAGDGVASTGPRPVPRPSRVHWIAFGVWASALTLAFVVGGNAGTIIAALSSVVVVAFIAWGVADIRSPVFGRALVSVEHGRGVALTFDDGPDPEATPALLDLLRRRGARATFFVVGARARENADLLRRCRTEGHEVGNHSDAHSNLHNFYTGRRLMRETSACHDSITSILGEAPRWYRPPVGLRNPFTHAVARAHGAHLVGWSVRSLDLGGASPERVTERVLARVEPGGIVLLHDAGQEPARLLRIVEGVLDGLEARGLAPVTLGELVEGAPAAVDATR